MSGKVNIKLNQKGGGAVEVIVPNQVSWPHEHILGGISKQRITYDQLTLAQFVQGFSKNILEETDMKCKELMTQYLADLMEDASDFSWHNAKAAHAVLLCEMERGSITWFDTDRIDRVCRAHAQKHSNPQKQNWVKGGGGEFYRKPWFCKNYQTNSCQHQKDHEVNGKIHKHVCAFCLNSGRILAHSERDCTFAKKWGSSSGQSKNELQAAQFSNKSWAATNLSQ